ETKAVELPPSLAPPTGGDAEYDAPTLLYVLATNFLLYVALVLITYLVVKLYIESAPGNPLFEEATTYNRVPATHSGLELTSMTVQARIAAAQGGGGGGSTGSGGGGTIMTPDGARRDSAGGLSLSRQSSWLDFDADLEHTMTRDEVFRRLVILAVGLNVTFVLWGVLQERILKGEYGDGEHFTYSYGLVFMNRFLGFLFSAGMMHYTRPKWSKALAYEYSFPAVSNMLSSWCQYEALKYVTFPTQVLSKSFKIVPIMVMGKILGNKEYPFYDYVVAGVIALGITLFLNSSEGVDFGTDMFGQQEQGSSVACGMMLLALYLVFDSFTSQWQSRMFTKHRDLSPIQMMFVMTAFSTIFSFVTLVHQDELVPFFAFVSDHPEIHLHFVAFGVCSTIGQLLIFHTIRSFGAVVFAIIMTTRIALSILVSCLIYDHPITELGLLGMLIVFGAVFYRINRRLQGKRLLEWEGVDDSKGMDMFHEWHEHLDL
ncbi:unnamed protein product, partial [Ectocarpus sp. 12 AP-2014]